MEVILERLSDILKEQKTENADQIIGKETFRLHFLLSKTEDELSADIEQILLSLITFNNSQLSPVTANGIGLCLLQFYKKQKKQDLWNFLNLMTDEIKKYNLVAIIVLGIISKDLGSHFKAKLFAHISTLANSPNPAHFPYICQCFRRIIIGTGTFLEKSMPAIFTFIKRCASATADNLRNEAIKTLPILCSHAKIDYQKLLPVIIPTLITESSSNRYFIAKSLGQLLSVGCNGDLGLLTKNYLLLLQNHEKNAQTVCYSLFISLRSFKPINLVVKLKTFSKFLYNLSTLKLNVQTLIYVTSMSVKAYFSVVGSTIGKSIVSHLIDFIQQEKLTISSSLILLVCVHCCGSDITQQILQQSLRLIYPLLDCESSDIRSLAIHIFSTLNTKDPKIANLYFESFLVLIQDDQTKSRPRSYISYCLILSMLMNSKSQVNNKIILNPNTILKNCQKVQPICEIFVDNIKQFDDLQFQALLILSIGLLQNNLLTEKIISKILSMANEMKFKSQEIIQYKQLVQQGQSNRIRNKRPENMLRSIKYLSTFFASVFVLKRSQLIKQILLCIPKFVVDILSISSCLSSSTIYCLCLLIHFIQMNENLAFVMSKASIEMIARIFASNSDFDFDTIITPFSNDIDIINLLYHTNNTPQNQLINISDFNDQNVRGKHVTNISTLLTTFFGITASSHKNAASRALIELFPIVLKNVNEKQRKTIVNSLFENQSEMALCGQLMLMKSILHKRSTFIFLPENTLPKLLFIKTNKNIALERIIASLVARWIHYYPIIIPAIFEHLEHPKKSADFSSLIISECSIAFTQDEYKERTIKLACNRALNNTSADSLFALLQIIKALNKKESELIDTLEKVLYSNNIKTVSELNYFVQCVIACGDISEEFITPIYGCLFLYNTFRYSSQLFAINLLNSLESSNQNNLEIDYSFVCAALNKIRSFSAPPLLLISSYSIKTYLEDVPMMFTILQQTGTKKVAESLVRTFIEYPSVPTWTDLTKRIILNNCVPPSERIGDNRVTPTRAVLIAAMQISILLVKKIRESFPENLKCIDIIIANAFNAIQMKDSKIDNNAFAIVSSVIANFSDVRTGSEPFLSLFNAQLNPMFNHACEENRKFQNVAEYCLEYLSFQKKKEEMEDSVALVSRRIEKLKISHLTSLVFARVSSKILELVPEEFQKLEANFLLSFTDILSSLCQQEITLQNFKKELLCFVKCVLKQEQITDEQKRILLLLILSQARIIGIDKTLLCATEYSKLDLLTPNDVEYILSYSTDIVKASQTIQNVVTSSPSKTKFVYKENRKKPDETSINHNSESENEEEENADEENAISIVNEEEQSLEILTHFLISVSSHAKGAEYSNTRKQLLSISLSLKPICFSSIAFLLQNTSLEEAETILPQLLIASSISSENEEYNKKAEAIRCLILSRMNGTKLSVIESILGEMCNSQSLLSIQNSLIQILSHFNTYEFPTIKEILPQKVSEILLPYGLSFLCSLMSDDKTKEIALYLIKNGAIDDLDSLLSLKDVPRVLHFLRLLFNTIVSIHGREETQDIQENIIETALVCVSLTDGVKERKNVLSIASKLFKDIDSQQLCEKVFNSLTKDQQTHVIKAFTPPKRLLTSTIQLVSFSSSPNIRRSSQNQGWQTLTVEDD